MGDGKVETLDVQVKVSKETYEVWKALTTIVREAKKAGKDGFQAIEDIPAVAFASMKDLSAALSGLDEVGEEVTMAMPEFIKANGLGAAEVGAAIAQKTE